MKASCKSGFTLVEVFCAIMLFSGVAYATYSLATSSKRFQTEATSAAGMNAYTNLQAQVALHGLDPTRMGNVHTGTAVVSPASGTAIACSGGTSDLRGVRFVRGQTAQFDVGSVKDAAGANRSLGGSAARSLVNYQGPSAGGQAGKGVGLGYALSANRTALPPASMQLVPPTFNFSGDITSAPFPLNNIVSYPPLNPPGTVYYYTLDGSLPTTASAVWNNNPSWTLATFPRQVSIRAFHSDPQYLPSDAAATTYVYSLSLAFARADGRASNLYGFTLPELGSAAVSGVQLTVNVPGAIVRYTFDGSDPASGGTVYTSYFAPPQALFAPNVAMRAGATSADPRFANSPVYSYTLVPNAIALPTPSITTSNAAVVPEGTLVNITFSQTGASTRSALNATPTPASSTALTLTLE